MESRCFGGATIGHCEKTSPYDHASIFEWLQMYSSLNLVFTVHSPVFSDILDLMSVGLDELRFGHKEFGYTVRIARSNFGCCCSH